MFNIEGKLFCCPVRDLKDSNIIFEKFEPSQIVDEGIFNQIYDYICENEDHIDLLNEKARYYNITYFYYNYIYNREDKIEHSHEDDTCEEFIMKKYKEYCIEALKNGNVCVGGCGKILEINKVIFRFACKNKMDKTFIKKIVNNFNDISSTINIYCENKYYPCSYPYFKIIIEEINDIKNVDRRENFLIYFIELLTKNIEKNMSIFSNLEVWDHTSEKYNIMYFSLINTINVAVRIFNWDMEFSKIIELILKLKEYKYVDLVFNDQSKQFCVLESLKYSISERKYKIVENMLEIIYNVDNFSVPFEENYLHFFGYHKFKVSKYFDNNLKCLKTTYNEKILQEEKAKIIARRNNEFKKKIKEMCCLEDSDLYSELNKLEEFSKN